LEHVNPPAPRPALALAPLHLRLFGLLIDYLLIVVGLNLASQLWIGADWDLRAADGSPWGDWVQRTAWAILLFLVKDLVRGHSPGKWLTGIAVRRADDPSRPAPAPALALRNLMLILAPLEAVLVLADRYGRRLGDRVARTVVIALPEPAPITRRLLVFASLMFASLLLGFLVAPWNMHRSAAYREAARLVASDPEVAARAGAGAIMDDSPEFQLDLRPEGGRAAFAFVARGPRGDVRGRVELTLDRAARRWQLGRFALDEPRLDVQDAQAKE
jgi:hypothetical protein